MDFREWCGADSVQVQYTLLELNHPATLSLVRSGEKTLKAPDGKWQLSCDQVVASQQGPLCGMDVSLPRAEGNQLDMRLVLTDGQTIELLIRREQHTFHSITKCGFCFTSAAENNIQYPLPPYKASCIVVLNKSPRMTTIKNIAMAMGINSQPRVVSGTDSKSYEA